MPDWTGSFRRPKMTTEKFKEMKAKYVAKHGYTMTVPGLSDIIHINFMKPLNEDEVKAWKRRDWKYFSEERYEEIKKMKKKKKDKFLAMVASPTPHIVNNAGSIMTSIDNAQDCMATLAWIGMLGIKAAPRVLGSVIGGPVTWLAAGAEMLNTMQSLGYKKIPALQSQHAMYNAEKASMKSTHFKVTKAAHMMNWVPHKGRVVEALQVSDNVFGIGICLGPIVGFAIEAVMGPYRRITGHRVDVKLPFDIKAFWTKQAQVMSCSAPVYFGSGLQTDDDEVMLMTMANYLAKQELLVGAKDWNAMENVENIDEIEKFAPFPQDILTIEVMEEEGIGILDRVGWPHSNKPWALMTDIVNELDQPCQDFARDFNELHKRDWWPYAFGALNNEAFCYTLATAEGEENITYDYDAVAATAQVLTQFDLYPDMATPEGKMQDFGNQIDLWGAMDIKPDLRLIMDYCKEKGIKLVHFEGS